MASTPAHSPHLLPANPISNFMGPHDKVKNNTYTAKYILNKQATKGSAKVKLPDGEKDVSDIDHENIFKINKIQ